MAQVPRRANCSNQTCPSGLRAYQRFRRRLTQGNLGRFTKRVRRLGHVLSLPNRDLAALIRDCTGSIEDFDSSIRDAHRLIEQRLGTLQTTVAEPNTAAETRQGGQLGSNVSSPSGGPRLVPMRPTSVCTVNTPRGLGSTAASTRDSDDSTVHLARDLIVVLRNHEQSLQAFQRMLRDTERMLRNM